MSDNPSASHAPADAAIAPHESATANVVPVPGASVEFTTLLVGGPCACGCPAKVGDNLPGLTLQEVRRIVRTLLNTTKPLRLSEREAQFYHAYMVTSNDTAAAEKLHLSATQVANWRTKYGLPPRGMSKGASRGMLNTGIKRIPRPSVPALTLYSCAICGEEAIGPFRAKAHSDTHDHGATKT